MVASNRTRDRKDANSGSTKNFTGKVEFVSSDQGYLNVPTKDQSRVITENGKCDRLNSGNAAKTLREKPFSQNSGILIS